jgi:hypothetical protein
MMEEEDTIEIGLKPVALYLRPEVTTCGWFEATGDDEEPHHEVYGPPLSLPIPRLRTLKLPHHLRPLDRCDLLGLSAASIQNLTR